jgi:L-threonylcarbamoyladenylate synthase
LWPEADAPRQNADVNPTLRVVADPNHLDPTVLAEAGELLRAGQLVAFPTETVYGLGADATNADAVSRIFEIKGRPATDPLIVHVLDSAAASGVAQSWNDLAQSLADRFWPGPLTLVLERSGAVVDAVGGGRSTVAVRVPAHRTALALLQAAQVPVAAPSANRFGRVSPTTADHVLAEFPSGVARLLDGGPTPLGVESTVLDLTTAVPTVLRPGGVTVEDLVEVLGQVEAPEREVVPESEAAAAPGGFLRHYAPNTPMVLVEGGVEVAGPLRDQLRERGVVARILELSNEPTAAATSLYGLLRNADSTADVLLACMVRSEGIGRAVNDRLFRAASGRVVAAADEVTCDRVIGLVG